MRLTAFCLALLMSAFASYAADLTGRASVIDGDTIEINGTRIRFDGIDAPESRQTCENASGNPYRCGKVSANALDEFLSKSRPTTCTATGKSYDRVVGHCRRADGQDVNHWMVRNGHAIDWPKYSKGRYASAQRESETERLGIWSGAFQPPCVIRRSKCD